MANETKSEAKGGRVQFENRTRAAYVIEHPSGDRIFGQSVDRDIPKDLQDPIHRRSPVVEFSREQFDQLPPHSAKFLDVLVAKGDLDRRDLAA